MNDNEPVLVTRADLAKLLRLSLRTLDRLRSAGRIPTPIQALGSPRWRRRDIEAFIESDCDIERFHADAEVKS